MCTRFSFDLTKEKIRKHFNIPLKNDLEKSFNVSPLQAAYVYKADAADLSYHRWGLIPYWAKNPANGDHLTHAMAEGIETKDSFRMSVRYKRCVVFADSYYDKVRKNNAEQHHRILLSSGNPIAMGAIWDLWTDERGYQYYSFALISTEANEELKGSGFARMPFIFTEEEQIKNWLNPELELQGVLKILRHKGDFPLQFYAISNAVEHEKNNYPELHREINLY
jgi:putative SOS response-associated peptidase YedK